MRRQSLLAICLVALFSATGFCQVTLEHKIIEGSRHTVETNAKIEQKLTIAGTEVDTSSETKSVVKGAVGKRDPEGKLRSQEKIDSLQIKTSVMGMDYTFDSANPDNKGSSPLEIIRDVHKALLNRTATIVYDKNNRVAAVESDSDIANALPAEVKALVKSELDPNTQKDAANDLLDEIKSEPVSKGDTWQRTRNMNFGGGQVMTLQTEYKYEGTIDKEGKKLEKITSKPLSVNFFLQDSPLPFTLKASDLKPVDSQGVLLFDREQGQTVESNSTLRVTGELTFVINDMELPSKLDLKIESAIVVKP